MSARTKPALLLIGPRSAEPGAIGGTIVSFNELEQRCIESGAFDVRTIDTSRGRAPGQVAPRKLTELASFARVIAGVLRGARDCDVVMFNASSRGFLSAGPLVWAAARACGLPLVARAFGGDLDQAHGELPRARRALASRTILRADLLLLQTRHLCEHFGAQPGVRWLPTTRDPGPARANRRGPCRRFLYLGQLRAEKGLDLLLAATHALPEGCELTLCGPLHSNAPAPPAHPRVHWVGARSRDEIARLLAEHDALLYPSRWKGEGLAGAVIEALQAGLPVVATRWRALPDLVRDGDNGLLIDVGDAVALAECMRRLAQSDALYQRLARGAQQSGRHFAAGAWHARLEQALLELVVARSARHPNVRLAPVRDALPCEADAASDAALSPFAAARPPEESHVRHRRSLRI